MTSAVPPRAYNEFSPSLSDTVGLLTVVFAGFKRTAREMNALEQIGELSSIWRSVVIIGTLVRLVPFFAR